MGNKNSKLNFDFSHDHPVVTLKKPKIRVFPKRLPVGWPANYQQLFQDTPTTVGYNYTSYHLNQGQLSPIEPIDSEMTNSQVTSLADSQFVVADSTATSSVSDVEEIGTSSLSAETPVSSLSDTNMNVSSMASSSVDSSVEEVSALGQSTNSSFVDSIRGTVDSDVSEVEPEYGIGGVNVESETPAPQMVSATSMFTLGLDSNKFDEYQGQMQADFDKLINGSSMISDTSVSSSSSASFDVVSSLSVYSSVNSVDDTPVMSSSAGQLSDVNDAVLSSLSNFDADAWLKSNLSSATSPQISFEEVHQLMQGSESSSVDSVMVESSASSLSADNKSVSSFDDSLTVDDDPDLDYDYDGDDDTLSDDMIDDDTYTDDNDYEDDLIDDDNDESEVSSVASSASVVDSVASSVTSSSAFSLKDLDDDDDEEDDLDDDFEDDVENDDDFEDEEEALADELDDEELSDDDFDVNDSLVVNNAELVQRQQSLLEEQILQQEDLGQLNSYISERLTHLNSVLDHYRQVARKNYLTLKQEQVATLSFANHQAQLVQGKAEHDVKVIRSFAKQKLQEYEVTSDIRDHVDELNYLQHRIRLAQHHVYDVKKRTRQLVKRIKQQSSLELDAYLQRVADNENYLLFQIEMMEKRLLH